MTIAQALAKLNAVKPHEYPEDVVIGWLADVEQLILNEVIMWHWPGCKPCHRPKPPAENPLDESAPPEGGDVPEPPLKPPSGPPGRYTTETPGSTVLLVPDPYSELYVHYLSAQIDHHNAETARYANSTAVFSASLTEFANWYNRTHMPVQRSFVRI